MRRHLILSLAALAFVAGSSATAQTVKKAESGTTQASATSAEPTLIIVTHKPAYPLLTCVACNKALPAKPVDYVTAGRLFRLDVEACKAAVDANVATMTKKIGDAVVAQQKPTYPMRISPVSGKALETTAVDHVWGTRLVRLADAAEVALFDANPGVSMQKLDKAYIDAQLPTYAATTCPVSKEPLAGEGMDPVNHLYGTKLIRFCCSKCVRAFEETPETYLKAMTASR
jgi:YHS domain-containing protein